MKNSIGDDPSEKFLDREMWLLSIRGGLGRTGIYAESSSELARKRFRDDMVRQLSRLETRYHTRVNSSDHVNWIEETRAQLEKDHDKTFKGGHLPFGIVQKVFNLRLKYLWCLGVCFEPPHFPVDRIMLSHIYRVNPPAWTKMKIDGYEEAISEATLLARPASLAVWELDVFNKLRRGSI